tara:strand:+ start:622 stop:1080 length:459 start_codon:yes stop_codon:yes gene_type:complete
MSNEIEVSVDMNHDHVDLIVPYEILGLLQVAEVDGEYVPTAVYKSMAGIIEVYLYEGEPPTHYADTVRLKFTYDTVVHSRCVADVEIRSVCAEFTIITPCNSTGALVESRYDLGFDSVGGHISQMLADVNDIDESMVREGALEMAQEMGTAV